MGLRTEVNTETILQSLWEEILKIQIAVSDANFFALGGHSLLAVELVARIEEEFGVEITMKDILENPELSSLASYISTLKVRKPQSTKEISLAGDGLFSLTPNQRHIWNLVSLFPQDITHNISNAIRIKRKLDIDLINTVLNQMFEENSALRMTFVKNEQGVFQQVRPFEEKRVEFIALNENQMKLVLNKEMEEVFHLERDELVKVKFFQLGEEDYIFFFMAHHIVWDGISNIVFFNTFLEKYELKPAESKKIGDYADYVQSLEEYFKTPLYRDKLSFWKERFSSIDNIPFMAHDFEGEGHLNESAVLNLKIEEDLLVQAEQYVRERKISLYKLFFACFQFLLYQKNGGQTQVVGTPVHGRSNRRFRKTLGYFINTLPFIHELHPDKGLKENLSKVIGNLAECFYHQDIPFEHLLKKTKANALLKNHSLFQTLFVYLDVTEEMKLFDGKELELVKIDRKATHCEIDFYLYKAEKYIDVVIEYRKNLFSRESMELFFDDYLQILKTLLTNDQILLEDLLGERVQKKKTFLDIINLTLHPPHSIPCFVEKIFDQIGKNKNKVALSYGLNNMTYGQLGKYSEVLAAKLASRGVFAGEVVGLYLERDQYLVPALLACLKIGAIYLPLDPNFPEDRLKYMSEKGRCKLVLTTKELNSSFLESEKVFVQDLDFEKAVSLSSPQVAPSSSAYLLFTSGSTGNPKGVEVTRENISNFLLSMCHEPGIKEDDKLLAVTTISFDISVLELFLPLYVGASIYLADKNEVIDPKIIKKIISEQKITIMQATPVTWRMLMQLDSSHYPELKVMSGGEALDQGFAFELVSRTKEVWNMYGPTETSVWSSVKRISIGDVQITVGKPILNTYFLILDEQMNQLAVGEKGRLFIGGKGVSKGYFQESELTAQKFVFHPQKTSEIIYDTGDVAYYNSDGEIICLGRADNQVKIRGYRIELGEIEEVILKDDNIYEAACKVIDEEIYAFVSLKNKKQDLGELKAYLARKIPRYMIPKRILILPQLPKTPNGKIDRKQLTLMNSSHDPNAVVETNDEIKKIVKNIWKKHLNLEHFSDEDSFFHLGGHSLIALDIFNRINSYFNINLDLSTLFTHSTISGLSSLINEKLLQKNESLKNFSYIVKINEFNESADRIFCFHGVGGNVLNYYPLGQVLGQFNFYGVQASGLNGKDAIISSLPEMAQAYIREIKAIQPQGPYLLAGGSMGGMIAMEVASQLVKSGDTVAHVFMFDTFGPELIPEGEEIRFDNILLRVSNKLHHKLKKLALIMKVHSYKLKNKVIPHHIRYEFISYKNLKAMKTFSPVQCHFPVTLIRATHADPYLGWKSFIKGKFRIIEINGEHSSFIETSEFLGALKKCVSTYKDDE